MKKGKGIIPERAMGMKRGVDRGWMTVKVDCSPFPAANLHRRATAMTIEPLLTTIEIAATLVFAISGLIEAVHTRMDVVGVFTIAFVTAFGGGAGRDMLLNRRRPVLGTASGTRLASADSDRTALVALDPPLVDPSGDVAH